MKKTKLIFELLFIFILPLLIMLFNVTFNVIPVDNNNVVSLVYSSTFVNSESPIYYLFEILFDVLNINNTSVIFKVLVDYTILWFIMFIIWHIFYGMFDVFVHLFTKSKYKEGE